MTDDKNRVPPTTAGPQAGSLAFVHDLANTNRAKFPQQIINAKRWLLWTEDKQPFYVDGTPRRGTLDTPADMARLATFDEAVAVLANSGCDYEGIGFALGYDGHLYWQGFDADKLTPEQVDNEIIKHDDLGYMEVSPSGRGFHVIGYGRHFKSLGSNGTGVEAYAGSRYFTFTSERGRGQPSCIADFIEGQVAERHRQSGQLPRTHQVLVDPLTVTDLRSALAHMLPDDYQLWIAMGHALWELGETGRGLWWNWSQGSHKCKPEDAKRWETFRGDRTGHQAVFATAAARGWVNPRSNAAQGIGKKAGATVIEATSQDEFALPVPELRPEALYGILGEIAAAGSAHTEAVPATLAINTLARFCAVVGRGPYITIGDDYRSLRLFVLIIGPTGVGRKGTSAQLPERIFRAVEDCLRVWRPSLLPLRYETAVSSGEGLVWMTRDPITTHEGEITDEGVVDKRVLLEISEFAGTLAQMKRETSTLTSVLRDAFDGRRLATPNKNNPCFATGAHFVTIGHITREELSALLTQTDVMNGFANRFMMVYSARNKRIHEPQPTAPEIVSSFAHRIAHAVKIGMERGEEPIPRGEDARRRWIEMSDELERRVRPANIAKLMARDAVYIWTLSAALALINCEQVVEVRHLDAALAWLDYWEDTANFCFTTAARHDEMLLAKAVADEIVEAVHALGGVNVKHSEVVSRISNGGKRGDRTAKEIAKGVAHLQNEAPLRIRLGRLPGAGRTATTYSAVKLT